VALACAEMNAGRTLLSAGFGVGVDFAIAGNKNNINVKGSGQECPLYTNRVISTGDSLSPVDWLFSLTTRLVTKSSLALVLLAFFCWLEWTDGSVRPYTGSATAFFALVCRNVHPSPRGESGV
jgi:hypothetical protein